MSIIFDACCAINLHRGAALDTVLALENVGGCVGPRVVEECGDDCGDALRSALGAGRLAALDDRRIGASLFLSLIAEHGLGEGETECLAAATLDAALIVASDDRRARTVAASLFGTSRVTGSLGLLRRCVAAEALTISEAFRCYAMMMEGGAFLPEVDTSFFDATTSSNQGS